MRRPLTPEEEANMASRYIRGPSVKFIAFALSRDPLTVKAALKKHGLRVERTSSRTTRWARAGSWR
jgi:hypothetical protein